MSYNFFTNITKQTTPVEDAANTLLRDLGKAKEQLSTILTLKANDPAIKDAMALITRSRDVIHATLHGQKQATQPQATVAEDHTAPAIKI